MIESFGATTHYAYNIFEDVYLEEREEQSYHKGIEKIEFSDPSRR